VSYDPRLASAVTFSLLSGFDQIKILDKLHLLVEVLEFLTDYIWTVAASGELLPTTGREARRTQLVAPEAFASTPLRS
jgi:hypothetical protein